MNYLAHGWDHLHDPYFLAGTAVPDWLNVSDRGVRVRSRHAAAFVDHGDPRMAALARGIARHHHDDGWFHESLAFAELSLAFTVRVRDALPPDDGLRPSFLGHILVELLLDAALMQQQPARLTEYYQAMATVDAEWLQTAVNQMAPRPAARLAEFIRIFCDVKFLWDYPDDARLTYRLNQVLNRVRLPALVPAFMELLPAARRLVADRSEELRSGEPIID